MQVLIIFYFSPMKGKIFRQSIVSLGLLAMIASCSTQPKKTQPTKKTPVKTTQVPPKVTPTTTVADDDFVKVNLPSLNREFRGVWIASVANINWPSRKDMSTDQQKAEAIEMLETVKNNNLNAVILQVRPSADALYKSSLEPWSYYLTGSIGKAPSPYYDPLEFWIKEAHERGIELHVWLNPYRAHHSNGGSVTSESMVKKSPDNVYRLKNGMYWFDPADQRTQDHVSLVVKDLVKRYDIDGLHFDDYFYPYASYNGGADFPDSKTWNNYKNSGGTLSRADWRRANVNKFVERIYKEIKAEKNYVKFGISPFGIWKPGYPVGITGSSQYDELYADAKLWLNQGWVDYFSPQLYWPINSKGQPFRPLLEWWQEENKKGRHLWPGLNTVEVKAADRATEIVNEILVSRQILKEKAGEVHWSMAGLTKYATMLPALKNGPYKEKALIPASPWLKTNSIGKPKLDISKIGNDIKVKWNKNSVSDDVNHWVLYAKYGEQWETQILNSSTIEQVLPKTKAGKTLSTVAIRGIDRLSNEGEYAAKNIK